MTKKCIISLFVLLMLSTSIITFGSPASSVNDFKPKLLDIQKQLQSISQSMFSNDLSGSAQSNSINRLKSFNIEIDALDKSIKELIDGKLSEPDKLVARKVYLANQYLRELSNTLDSYASSATASEKYKLLYEYYTLNNALYTLLLTI